MYHWLKNYFGFSRRELNGISVIVVLLFLTVSLPTAYEGLAVADHVVIDSVFREMESIESAAAHEKDWEIAPQTVSKKADYFVFDPNNLTIEKWRRLGLSEKQISNIKNYESKGGRFNKKEDLNKIYSLSDVEYKNLEPYIVIQTAGITASDTLPQRISASVLREPTLTQINLNLTDSMSLIAIPGIGATFSARIIKFRDLLGGFIDVEQLMEVYGFDTLRYRQIYPYVTVDATDIKQIDVNHAAYEELVSHPYITKKAANLIVQYRKQHGFFNDIEVLKNAIPSTIYTFDQVEAYLSFIP